ncbi:hypothetical protein HK104_007913 [Borealophlyctis nickersoniae]|nr:hypothetical protein HK104_007913 [Borealophlyctis nickersoniae]
MPVLKSASLVEEVSQTQPTPVARYCNCSGHYTGKHPAPAPKEYARCTLAAFVDPRRANERESDDEDDEPEPPPIFLDLRLPFQPTTTPLSEPSATFHPTSKSTGKSQ